MRAFNHVDGTPLCRPVSVEIDAGHEPQVPPVRGRFVCTHCGREALYEMEAGEQLAQREG